MVLYFASNGKIYVCSNGVLNIYEGIKHADTNVSFNCAQSGGDIILIDKRKEDELLELLNISVGNLIEADKRGKKEVLFIVIPDWFILAGPEKISEFASKIGFRVVIVPETILWFGVDSAAKKDFNDDNITRQKITVEPIDVSNIDEDKLKDKITEIIECPYIHNYCVAINNNYFLKIDDEFVELPRSESFEVKKSSELMLLESNVHNPVARIIFNAFENCNFPKKFDSRFIYGENGVTIELIINNVVYIRRTMRLNANLIFGVMIYE